MCNGAGDGSVDQAYAGKVVICSDSFRTVD
jgi:hypothetical protein